MTWGELRKCRARSRSSERLGATTGVGVDDEDEESLVDGGASVETALEGPAAGCEPSSLLAVIKRAYLWHVRLVPVVAATDQCDQVLHDPLLLFKLQIPTGLHTQRLKAYSQGSS